MEIASANLRLRVEEAKKDPEWHAKVKLAKSAEEYIKLCREKRIELSEEDKKALAAFYAEKIGDKLSDSELDQAVGGWFPILNDCRERWDDSICNRPSPITGDRCCPHLELSQTTQEVRGRWYRVFSCRKGYFSEVLGNRCG